MYESRSYVFPGAMGNSKLHAVLVENICVLVGFIYEKIFVLIVLKIFDALELFLDVEDEQLVDKA